MTTIDVPALYEPVDAPVGVPYRFGLSSVLEFDPSTPHEEFGITWESQNNADALITNIDCDPPIDTLTTADYCSVHQFDPFTAYIWDTDSAAGSGRQFHEARARQRFSLAEQHAVELQFSTDMLAAVSAVTVTGGTTPGDKALDGLAIVEQELSYLTGAEGVIHMDRYTAIHLSDQLVREGGMLRTKLGTRVAAYGGWDDYTQGSEPTAVTILGTGPLKALRSPVMLSTADGISDTNDVSIIASRTYVLGYDSGLVGATATL